MADDTRSLELLPAVDVQGGRAVQLVQGVAGSEKTFGDPVEAALLDAVRGETVSETSLADPEDALDFAAWDLVAERGV